MLCVIKSYGNIWQHIFIVSFRKIRMKILKPRLLFGFLWLLCSPPAHALVLDWAGAYKLEEEFITTAEQSQFHLLHNLWLQPDIKVFDGLSVKSWFQLAPQEMNIQASAAAEFYNQNGVLFGRASGAGPISLSARSMYLQLEHDFGLLEIGWKPHHFGLGMFYNDGSHVFSPVYNKQGSRGMLSWKLFLGSSYYVQPIVHYIDHFWAGFFIQGGVKKNSYGIELMYKTAPIGLGEGSPAWQFSQPSYFGAYAYYKQNKWAVEAEGGYLDSSVFGVAVKTNWRTPWKKLKAFLNLGGASSEQSRVFYFDPSFSSQLGFLIERYEGFKTPRPEYLNKSLFYAFHSAFYVSPGMSFAVMEQLDLKTVFSIHLAYPSGEVKLYCADMIWEYHHTAGLKWISRLGILFPQNEGWHIGINSGAAITF